MHSILFSILAAAMLAAGALAQLVVPTFNNTPQAGQDKDGALRLHNFYRGQVGVPDLTWCDNLTDVAQVAADWEAGADIPETPINFTRRSPENANYSLQITYVSPGTPRDFGDFYQATLNFWYDRLDYHGEVIPNGDFLKYSPFSRCPLNHSHRPPGRRIPCVAPPADKTSRREAQMVWNSTRCLAMAGATSRENGTFVVAAYSPPGNM